MWSLIKTLLSGLLSLILKRKAEKTIEVKKYDKYEKWEKEYHALQDKHKQLIRACKQATSFYVEAIKSNDTDRIAKWRIKRDELHAARDNCFDRIVEHQRRKPEKR